MAGACVTVSQTLEASGSGIPAGWLQESRRLRCPGEADSVDVDGAWALGMPNLDPSRMRPLISILLSFRRAVYR